MGTFRFGQVKTMKAAEDDNALNELRKQVVDEKSFGSDAPTSATPGNIYYRKGATAATALKMYIKDPETQTWWGG